DSQLARYQGAIYGDPALYMMFLCSPNSVESAEAVGQRRCCPVLGIRETYEPDVGASDAVRSRRRCRLRRGPCGLYTPALGRCVRPGGKVIAFESDPTSFDGLTRHVALNGLADSVEHSCGLRTVSSCR